MKLIFGAINGHGQWWDGKDWRKWADKKDSDACIKEVLRIISIVKTHDDKNCHVDGCFECPRCRLMHFVPDNYDLLCDGCCELLLAYDGTTIELKDNILLWRKKAKHFYSGGGDGDISERHALRKQLTT